MDLAFLTQDILLTAAVFAPAVVLMGLFGFLGLTTLLERSGAMGAKPTLNPAAHIVKMANPAPGPIVEGLNAAIAADAHTASAHAVR